MTDVPALLSFVPAVLRGRVRGGELPIARVENLDGIVLASDVSGFSTLALSLRDTAGGVEELNAIINGSFAHLIDVIVEAGGDVLGFGGDALTAFWPAGPSAALAAGWAALEAQRRLADDARVKVRIGVAAGPLALWTVGGEDDRWFVTLSGDAPATAAALQAGAPLGEVAVSDGFIAAAGGRARTTPAGPGAHRLDAIDHPGAPPGRPAAGGTTVDDSTVAALRRYVPGGVVDRVLAGQHRFLSELRTVTILMLRAPGRDTPSELTELQDVMLTVQRTAHRYEGTVELGVDDKGITFLVTFGMPPHSHEDDVDRALAAARAIDEQLTADGIEHGIGVATGLAYCGTIGNDARREYTVLSDVACTSARLAAAACRPEHAAIIYDRSTAEAARARWTFDAPLSLRLKDRADLATVYSRAGRVARSGLTAGAIVGRGAELARILELAAAPPEHPGGRLVLVEGALGAGKSSLLGAVQESLIDRGAHVRVGFADALEHSAPLHAWTSVFAGLLGIDGLERADAAARLAERVGPLAPLLGTVLRLDLPDTEACAALPPEQRVVATRSLLVELLAADRDVHRGLVVFLEDAHWFDSASWGLLVDVLALPGVTVIATSRPAGDDTAAELARVADATTTIRLHPLAPDEIAELARARLGVEEIDDAVRDLLVKGCRGNPFFTVEVVQTLLQREAIRVAGGRARLTDDGALQVPMTIQAAITARVDALSADEQLTLKVASVIGSLFTDPVLAEIHPTARPRPALVQDLGGLIDRELVDPDTADSHAYSFHHALTREVAYGLMVRNQRRALHRAVAEFYESVEGDLDHLYPVLAHHWRHAEDDAKAVQYLARAAVSSLANGMPRESVMQGVQAARILGIELETDPARIVALLPAELTAIDELMAGRRPGDLAALPELMDPDVATGIGIVLQSMPSAHQSLQTELFALMAVRNLNLTLRFGAGPLAACVYAMYSIVLRGLGADRELAYEFSALARDVDAAAGAPNAGVVNFVHVWFNSHWRHPYSAGVPVALAGAEAGLAGGDPLYGSFNLAAATTLTAHSGAPLDEVVAMAERHLGRIGPRSSTASFHNTLEMQVARALAGRTGALESLTGEGVDEQELAAMTQTENFNQVGFYHVAKLRLLYLSGRPAEALEFAALAERLLPSFLGQVGQIDLTVYGALARLAVAPGEPVAQALSELELWAAACPENFADKVALVRGESRAVAGEFTEADALFAEADARATANGLVQWAALACERRGHAARAAGSATAAGHFAAAAEHYGSWGAAAKAAELAALAG
ncbi:MAG: hypothetical protein JWO74_1881 [Solirubrobacterales bacterium]|nr:hypothetical protein [Solirubrobacterales bacterium]